MYRFKQITICILLTIVCVQPAEATQSDNKVLQVSGKADKALKIDLHIYYVTTKDTPFICNDYNFLAGKWRAEYEFYSYTVSNNTGKYSIELPLSEINPDSYCGWRPSAIFYSATLKNAAPDAAPIGNSSLIGIDSTYAPSLDKVSLQCNSPKKQMPKRSHWLTCLKGKDANLTKTITPNQKHLIINFSLEENNNTAIKPNKSLNQAGANNAPPG